MGESEESSSSSSWRFSMELLSHVHTLQVFLFNSSPQVKPDQDCVSLQAALLCAPPALSCSWKTPHQARSYALCLPLPLLLFDYSASPRISTLPDCIQLSLPLVPLPPFHLHAFSSLSLGHDAIHTHDPDSTCVPNSSVQHEADCGNNVIHGDDASSHSSDGDKNHACDDTHQSGYAATCTSTVHGCCHHDCASEVGCNAGYANDAIPKNAVHAAADDCHGNDDAHENHDHDDNHAVEGLASHADDSVHGDKHQDHEFDGTHKLGLVATPALNNHGCHHDCVQQNSFVHEGKSGVYVNNDPFKSHEPDTNEVWHVASTALDISCCHYHHSRSEVEHDAIEAGEDIHRACLHAVHACNNSCRDGLLPTDGIKASGHSTHSNDCSFLFNEDGASKCALQCQLGTNVADLQNNGSCLPSQPRDSMVCDSLTHQGLEDQKSQGATIFHCKKCSLKVSKNPVRNLVQLPCFDWRDIVENWFGACCCSFGSKAEILSANFEKSLHLRPGKCLVGSSTFYVNFSDVTVETKSVVLNMDNKIRQLSTLHFLALGNGFMVWENQQSKYFSWLPVYCTDCASLLGAYACKSAGSGLIREGLHLFRSQITASNADDTLDEMLRYATFKELLTKELRLRTEENTSYRFLIRSLSSQLPLLQLVVLDYDSLICTGNVTAHMLDSVEHPQITSETTGLVGETGLQRSIKVLFLDCTGLSANGLRSTERWVQEYDAETIFMLEEFVNILKRELLSNRVYYPAAHGLSQVFHGSFIHLSLE